ncbi:MAG: hypothetical protein R3C24_15445 [Cyanobacteriota/Melainabacteria group bacterium]|nr:hypothetical protein [Cyanobacteria bacterium HKST-UBA01]MCB9470323.1 hypothetical protein [Candidatus Obscuribacterales bacterium]
MHDCPTCRVPLHGYEEVCPSCGTRQRVRRSSSSLLNAGPKKPPVNLIPFVIVFFVLGAGTLIMAQSSWIGQIMTRGPVEKDPLADLTVDQARQILTEQINQNLTAAGATGKFTWTVPGGEAPDPTYQGPLELTIDTELAEPDLRRQIIDPVKQYMPKAQIPTLVMNDSKSHATWTYSVQMPKQAASQPVE